MDTHMRPPERSLYRAGGLASITIFAGYLLTIPVYMAVGEKPTEVAAQLAYFGTHASGWWVILGLMVFTDLLYVPVWLALYQGLVRINRLAMQTALAFQALFVMLDLAVTWTAFGALIHLGTRYLAAGDPAGREALVAAAAFPSGVLETPTAVLYAIVFPSAGTLVAGLVLLRGPLGKTASYLALVAGVTGLLAAAPLMAGETARWPHVLSALLATLWHLVIGIRLLNLNPTAAADGRDLGQVHRGSTYMEADEGS